MRVGFATANEDRLARRLTAAEKARDAYQLNCIGLREEADRNADQRNELMTLAHALLQWATLAYSKDPEYWIGVRLTEYRALDAAVGNLSEYCPLDPIATGVVAK